jgi:nitrogen fixation protein NifU and related proteins
MCAPDFGWYESGYNVDCRMFSPAVIDHFEHPRNVGELSDASAVIEVTNPVCGDVLRLSVKREGDLITAARFKTQGCVTAIASSSCLTEMIVGGTVAEATQINFEQISAALGGLPPATMHGAQLAVDAIRAILAKLR